MLQFESKLFREQTRDFLLENMVQEKWCLWLNGLKSHYSTSEEKIRETLKSKFRKCVMEHSQNGTLVAVNKKMVFKEMKDVRTLLTEIGELFLCNIQVNDEIIHMSAENFMILNYRVDEKSIRNINLTPTMFGLHNTAQTSTLSLCSEFDLSDSEEEEESPVQPPASFLSADSDPFGLETMATANLGTDENTSPFEMTQCFALVKDKMQDYILKNLKKEPTEEEEEEKRDTIVEQKKTDKAGRKKEGKNSSKSRGGKRKKTNDDEEEDVAGAGKKKSRKESTDEKKMKKNVGQMEMRDSDMDLLTQHLDAHTVGTLKSGRKLINENIPKINEIFLVISKYVLTLKKMLKNIPYKIDDKTGEIILLCGGCHLHCVSNWNLPGPSGRPAKELCGALL